MRFLTLLLSVGLLVSLAPSAWAAGHLVNVGVGSSSFVFGVNVFGGSGDTLDVGLLNEQCSDEADVVDVGIMNTEGGEACREGETCRHEEGYDPLGKLLGPVVEPGGEPTPAHCSDDSDAVDVGVLNREGTATYRCEGKECEPTFAGDDGDAVDAGVLNCEYGDRHDGVDLGVVNNEWDDRWDILDLSILNNEWTEGGDTNGIALGLAFGVATECRSLAADGPIGSVAPHLPLLP